jgi:hypothetical protein
VRALVECCADFNARRVNGDTAVILAERAGRPETLLELANLGADIHAIPPGVAGDVDTSISPIAVAAQGHKGVLRALAKLGVQSAASALAAAAAAAADSEPAPQERKLEAGEMADSGGAADSEPAPKKPKLEAGEMADSGGAGEETKT